MNKTKELKQASLLMTGAELMSGDTIDTNSAYIAQCLLEIGIEVTEIITVGDQFNVIANQIERLCQNNDLLIINGGLGPTQDDLTAEVVAQVAHTLIETHEEAKTHILHWCQKRNITVNDANLKQAQLPSTCKIYPDAPGSAPAFYLTINDCLVIATPGVPSELKNIMQMQLLRHIKEYFCLTPAQAWEKVSLIGIGESRLQQIISDQLVDIDDFFEIGFRVAFPLLELKYKPLKITQHKLEEQEIRKNKLLELVADYIVGFGTVNLSKIVINLLHEKKQTLSTAESCTGGLIASEITKIAGASAVFLGGIVCYSNAIKQSLLNVPHEILEANGAVSKETVDHMLMGIFDVMQSDYGIAVSGIAGPDGGSPGKPVGTVWIAWGTKNHPSSVCLNISLERQLFQALVSAICLDLTRRHLLGLLQAPDYLHRWQL